MEEKNKKEYLHELYSKRLHSNTNLPHAQQFEYIRKQINVKEVPYCQTMKKLVKIEVGACPNCDSTSYCVDYYHGERVCPECGCVIDTVVFERPSYAQLNKVAPREKFSYKDKEYLKAKNYTYVTEAKEWKKRQIQREIDVLSSSMELNISSKQKVETIIEKVGLKKLYSRGDVTTIICAVIRYILKNQKYVNLVLLRYDRNIFKDNLTPKEYNIVERNIEKHFGEDYVNTSKTKKKKNNKRKRKNKKHNKIKS